MPHRPLRRTGGERGSAQLVDDAGNHLVPSPGAGPIPEFFALENVQRIISAR